MKLKELTKYLRRGDVDTICRQASCSRTTYKSMLARDDLTLLTLTERSAYDAFIAIVQQRRLQTEQQRKLIKQISKSKLNI